MIALNKIATASLLCFAAAFTLSPGEKIFGCGESFTGLDKRGQKLTLWTNDANGVENQGMYIPVPFFMSSRGYGMFLHTTTPITLDFGHDFSGVNSMMIGDDALDLFVFLGTPKEILNEYTGLTGKSPRSYVGMSSALRASAQLHKGWMSSWRSSAGGRWPMLAIR